MIDAKTPPAGTQVQNSITSVLGNSDYNPVSTGQVSKAQIRSGVDGIATWMGRIYWFGVLSFGINFLIQLAILLKKRFTLPVIRDGGFRIVEVSGKHAPCSFANMIFINPAQYDWATYCQILEHEKIHVRQAHSVDLVLSELVLVFQWFNPFAWLYRKEVENNIEFLTDSKILQQKDVDAEQYQINLLKISAPHFPLRLTNNYNQSLLKRRIFMMGAKKSGVQTAWKYFFLLPLFGLTVSAFNRPVNTGRSDTEYAKENGTSNADDVAHVKGHWTATVSGGRIIFQLQRENDFSWDGLSFPLNDSLRFAPDGTVVFEILREAGKIEFNGKFINNVGSGSFRFYSDSLYQKELLPQGISIQSDREQLTFYLIDIKKSFVQMLRSKGFPGLDQSDIVSLAAAGVDESYIDQIRAAGLENIHPKHLVPFKALKITGEFISGIRAAGGKNLTAEQIIQYRLQKEDDRKPGDLPQASSGFSDGKISKATEKRAGSNSELLSHSPPDNHAAEKEEGTLDEYRLSLKEVGYDKLDPLQASLMKAQGITSAYIQSFHHAGYKNISVEDLIALKASGTTVEMIQQYQVLGIKGLTYTDIITAILTGTSPKFINDMWDVGYRFSSLKQYIKLKESRN